MRFWNLIFQFDEDIIVLNVSVHDLVLVEESQTFDNAANHILCFSRLEYALLGVRIL